MKYKKYKVYYNDTAYMIIECTEKYVQEKLLINRPDIIKVEKI